MIIFGEAQKIIKKQKTKKAFRTQFIISIALFFLTIIIYLFNLQSKNSNENIAQKITNDYSISRLYSSTDESKEKTYEQNGQTFTVIGMIEIPKIKIYYPIISESNDELLKIAPCRISGPLPNEYGNLCIAGHNYDNYKFFSKLSDLSTNDEIIIHSMNGDKVFYNVFKIYEVLANDLSPLEASTKSKKELTLITCNNLKSSNRIIIKAISK